MINVKAIETTGHIDKDGHLNVQQKLDALRGLVRVIVLFPEDDKIKESEWHQSAKANTAFDFLNDQKEDIYTLADGKPFNAGV